MSETLAEIGQRLKAARERAGLSLRDVGARCGRNHATLHRAEQGKEIAASALLAIARALNVSLDEATGAESEWHEEAMGHWLLRRSSADGTFVGSVSRPGFGWSAVVTVYRNGGLSVRTEPVYRGSREDAQAAAETMMDELAGWFGWKFTLI